jgi:hypothetical protein
MTDLLRPLDTKGWAPAASRHRVTRASHRAAEEASRPSGRVPTGAAANDETPFGREARKAAAIRDARDRFYAQWLILSADMAAEIARIEREM